LRKLELSWARESAVRRARDRRAPTWAKCRFAGDETQRQLSLSSSNRDKEDINAVIAMTS